MTTSRIVLTLSCTDRPGIVGAVGTFLAERGCNIVESAQFGDVDTGRFFMRVVFEPVGETAGLSKAIVDYVASHPAAEDALDGIAEAFLEVAGRFGMQWAIHDAGVKPRALILVSKQDHCLNDLLYRTRIGALPMSVAAIVSNHADAAPLAASYGVPFHHLPVSAATKPKQEAKLRAILDENGIELVVLARYMQVLSDGLARDLAGRAINIHHGLLPSFKGAKPYHQAYDRGVKLIGATAHYVTSDLDEGPIIDQEVARVDYNMRADDLVALGRDVECLALARAVKFHLERRVFLNGAKTVVFR
jgi:formyltetrahydrofolate deformylase